MSLQFQDPTSATFEVNELINFLPRLKVFLGGDLEEVYWTCNEVLYPSWSPNPYTGSLKSIIHTRYYVQDKHFIDLGYLECIICWLQRKPKTALGIRFRKFISSLTVERLGMLLVYLVGSPCPYLVESEDVTVAIDHNVMVNDQKLISLFALIVNTFKISVAPARLLHSSPPPTAIATHILAPEIQGHTTFKMLNYFNELPNELLSEILFYLQSEKDFVTTFASICRRSNEATHNFRIRVQKNHICELLRTKRLLWLWGCPDNGEGEKSASSEEVMDYLHQLQDPDVASMHTGSQGTNTISILYGLQDEFRKDLWCLAYMNRLLVSKHKISMRISFPGSTMNSKIFARQSLFVQFEELHFSELKLFDHLSTIVLNRVYKVMTATKPECGSSLSPKLLAIGNRVFRHTPPTLSGLHIHHISLRTLHKPDRPLIFSVLSTTSFTCIELYECGCDWSQTLPHLKLEHLNTFGIVNVIQEACSLHDLVDFLARHPLIHTLCITGNPMPGELTIESCNQSLVPEVLDHDLRWIGGSPFYLYHLLDRIQRYPKLEKISLYTEYRTCGCGDSPTDYSAVLNKLGQLRVDQPLELHLRSLEHSGILWIHEGWDDGRITPRITPRWLPSIVKKLKVLFHGVTFSKGDFSSELGAVPNDSETLPKLTPNILEKQPNAALLVHHLFPGLDSIEFSLGPVSACKLSLFEQANG